MSHMMGHQRLSKNHNRQKIDKGRLLTVIRIFRNVQFCTVDPTVKTICKYQFLLKTRTGVPNERNGLWITIANSRGREMRRFALHGTQSVQS